MVCTGRAQLLVTLPAREVLCIGFSYSWATFLAASSRCLWTLCIYPL